jgi:hypothetical protein
VALGVGSEFKPQYCKEKKKKEKKVTKAHKHLLCAGWGHSRELNRKIPCPWGHQQSSERQIMGEQSGWRREQTLIEHLLYTGFCGRTCTLIIPLLPSSQSPKATSWPHFTGEKTEAQTTRCFPAATQLSASDIHVQTPCLAPPTVFFFFFLYFLQYWGLNSGPTP